MAPDLAPMPAMVVEGRVEPHPLDRRPGLPRDHGVGDAVGAYLYSVTHQSPFRPLHRVIALLSINF